MNVNNKDHLSKRHLIMYLYSFKENKRGSVDNIGGITELFRPGFSKT